MVTSCGELLASCEERSGGSGRGMVKEESPEAGRQGWLGRMDASGESGVGGGGRIGADLMSRVGGRWSPVAVP